MNTVGTYTLTYNASDTEGNAATSVTRTVTVVDTTTSGGPSVASDMGQYGQGDPIVISFSGGSGSPTDQIKLFSLDVNNQRIDPAVDWVYLNGTQVLGSAITYGDVTFLPANSTNRSVALAPGGYNVALVSGDGAELAGTGFGIQGGSGPKPAEGIVSTPGEDSTPRRIGKMNKAITNSNSPAVGIFRAAQVW